MSGQWKPGMVAMVTHDGRTRIGLRGDQGWTFGDFHSWLGDAFKPIVRPLVVIDPEDAEAVERLAELVSEHDRGGEGEQWIADVAAALCEFARPTPPKCPATLVIGGERIECERDPGHVTDHRNDSIGQGVRWSA